MDQNPLSTEMSLDGVLESGARVWRFRARAETLDLWSCLSERLRRGLDTYDVFVWDRDGWQVLIPRHILQNAVREMDDWLTWKQYRPSVAIPKGVGVIHWSQLPLRTEGRTPLSRLEE